MYEYMNVFNLLILIKIKLCYVRRMIFIMIKHQSRRWDLNPMRHPPLAAAHHQHSLVYHAEKVATWT